MNKDPLSVGIWILTYIGNKEVLAKVEDCDSESLLRDELFSNGCVKVALKTKYIFSQVQFPIPEVDQRTGRQTGNFLTGNLSSVGKHELLLDLRDEFVTYASVSCVTFLSDISPDDIKRLKKSIQNVEEVVEMEKRAANANILLMNR